MALVALGHGVEQLVLGSHPDESEGGGGREGGRGGGGEGGRGGGGKGE